MTPAAAGAWLELRYTQAEWELRGQRFYKAGQPRVPVVGAELTGPQAECRRWGQGAEAAAAAGS